MGWSMAYCPARRTLEERSWNLVSRLSATTGRLVGSAAMDYKTFNATLAECGEIRALVAEAHRELKAHRASHGC